MDALHDCQHHWQMATQCWAKARRPLRQLLLTPVNIAKDCSGVVPESWSDSEWQRVIFSDESRFSLGGDDQRICVWRHRGQHQDEWLAATCHISRRAGVPPPLPNPLQELPEAIQAAWDGLSTGPLGTSTAPYRDVWRVGLTNTTAQLHTERQTSVCFIF